MKTPVTLVILDGWGIAEPGPGNAITQAKIPTMAMLWNGFPHTQLEASGEAVGLPRGEDGNTETGHLNLGAGSVVYQDLPRINMAIADGSFLSNPTFVGAMRHVTTHQSKLHLLSLIGSGGVHSDIDHLFALMRMATIQNLTSRVFLHLFTDGRDSPPTSALTYIASVRRQIASMGIGAIATVMGRYWAMDRDFRWDRTAKSYRALTEGQGHKTPSVEDAISASYEQGITDEFIEPIIAEDQDGRPVATIGQNDAVIFCNFRIDRPRQLTKAFVLDRFEQEARTVGFDPYAVKYFKKHVGPQPRPPAGFDRGEKIKNLHFVTMTQYEAGLPVDVAFPPQTVPMPIGRVISDRHVRQARFAETEKERFVTYYFNGQREEPFESEDRFIIPSPMVATYDRIPEMSTPILANVVSEKLESGLYQLLVVNVACPDMVAHTGNLTATIKACEAADEFVRRIFLKSMSANGALVVTADHGNAEELINAATGQVDTEHSTSPVPFIVAHPDFQGKNITLQSGTLADVAPTILELMSIEKPLSMTGRSLIARL